MVDFHSHILPGVDDGAQDVDESVQMLRECASQGVTDICATSHFNADCDDPDDFLYRRNSAALQLVKASGSEMKNFPSIHLGAEIMYFPGMSTCSELKKLKIGNTSCLLVEPPMTRWSDYIIDEIEEMGKNIRCIPVIAHLDRYIRLKNDSSYLWRIKGRKILIQINASFFLDEQFSDLAFTMLMDGNVHFIGSDTHGMSVRRPNMSKAASAIASHGCTDIFENINSRAMDLLHNKL